VYVCVRMCVCVCMYVFVCVCVCARARAGVCVRVSVSHTDLSAVNYNFFFKGIGKKERNTIHLSLQPLWKYVALAKFDFFR